MPDGCNRGSNRDDRYHRPVSRRVSRSAESGSPRGRSHCSPRTEPSALADCRLTSDYCFSPWPGQLEQRAAPAPVPPRSLACPSCVAAVGGRALDVRRSPRPPARSGRAGSCGDRPILRSSASTRRTFTSISSPTLTTSSGVLDLVVGQLGDVQQALQARLQLDEHAEVGELRDLALHDLARLVAAGDVAFPRVVGHLLEAQGDALAAPGRRSGRRT